MRFPGAIAAMLTAASACAVVASPSAMGSPTAAPSPAAVAPPAAVASPSAAQSRSGTPGQVVRSFVALIAGPRADLARACELLTANARDAYSSGETPCWPTLGLVLFYDEERSFPALRSARVLGVRVSRGSPAIATADVRFRYAGNGRRPPRRVRTQVTIPVRLEPGGWRVADPDLLASRAVLSGDTRWTRAEARRNLAFLRRLARRARALRKRRDAATRDVATGLTDCPQPLVAFDDPARDLVSEGGKRARRQDGTGIDALWAGHAREPGALCFELRFREPLGGALDLNLNVVQRPRPRRFATDRSGSWAVRLHDGRAVAFEDDEPERYFAPELTMSPARDRLRIRLATRVLASEVDFTRPYRWSMSTHLQYSPMQNLFTDEIPEQSDGKAPHDLPSP